MTNLKKRVKRQGWYSEELKRKIVKKYMAHPAAIMELWNIGASADQHGRQLMFMEVL